MDLWYALVLVARVVDGLKALEDDFRDSAGIGFGPLKSVDLPGWGADIIDVRDRVPSLVDVALVQGVSYLSE